jgi:hypothetical protein
MDNKEEEVPLKSSWGDGQMSLLSLTYIIARFAKYSNIERLGKSVHWTFCAIQPARFTV